MKKMVIGILALAAATLAGLGLEAATPEKATGSSAYFHVNTSNDTVRIENVVCKYCDGEYGKGKGRNATFLNGVSLNVDFTMNAVSEVEDDPIDHYVVNKMEVDIPSFTIDVGALKVGEKFEVRAVTRNGSESKPFRVNFDIARVPDCFAHEPAASIEDDRVLYTQLEFGSYWFFQSMDGALKLRDLMRKSNWVDGLKFNWYPQIHLGMAMDSSTAKVLVGTLSGLGGKAVGNISRDSWKKLGKQRIGRLAGVDLHVNLEGDIIGKWNPEKKIWVNIESVIGADIVYSGQVSFRFPQTLYLVYVSGGLSGETHCLISPRSDNQWKLTSNILGQPLIEGFVEGGAGIDGFKIAAGGELGLILHSQNPDMSDLTKGLQDWGWGGQLYWTAQFFGKTWGSQGVRQDETSIDEASYYFQYWWWHNGVHADSWSSDEAASAALQQVGPTKANAAKLLAAGPRLLAAAAVEPEPCNPQPALAMRGGVDALLYLTNASARSASDQSMLVCRTGADGAWGAVETPWDDGTADLSPSVGVAADGTVIAAWVNLKGAVGEPTHLTELTRKMEIAVGVRNPSTGAWTCRNLTADDQVDFSPRVAVSADGSAYVAWCANADNAFYGSNTVVKCAAFAGGAWGSVTSLGKVGSVNGLAAACQGANGAIVCTVEDGDAHRVRCFEVAGDRVSRSATVESASWTENPDVAYDAAGVAQFHWLQEGVLRTKSGFAAGGDAIATGAAEVTVPRDAAYMKDADGVQGLVWQDAPKTDGSQNGVMLMARGADGKWQVPATLWLPEERARAFSGGYAADGTLRLAYESARGSRDNKGVMRYGAATLRTFELDGGVDVSVTANEIGVEGGRLFYGAANEFFATIHNLGRTDAVNVPIKFVVEANGTDFEFYNGVANVAAGGSVCVTSEWTVAQGYTNLCFKVLLDPDQTIAERNRANNAAEWRPASGSLAIADERFVRETRNVCQVNAKVVTDGALVIPEGTVVEYRRGGLEGALLGTDMLGEIVPGKGYATGFRWDMSSTTFADAWETVYLAIRGNDHAMTAVRVLTTLDTDGDGAFDGDEEMAGTDPRDPTSKPDDAGGGSGGGDEPIVEPMWHFDANGGTGTMEDVTVLFSCLFPYNAFVREGYEFLGWARSPDATEAEWADGECPDAGSFEPTEDAVYVLYAVWRKVGGDEPSGPGETDPTVRTAEANGYTWSYRIVDGAAEIVGGWYETLVTPEPTGEVVIPAMLGGCVVGKIGDYAFAYCDGMTEVTIPTGVTIIGTQAFDGCAGLTSVTLPIGLKQVDAYAFRSCRSLASVALPEGMTTIGDLAFYGCESLTAVTIPKGAEEIGDQAFCNCESLTTVSIPSSVTSIGMDAFENCGRLTEFVVASDNADYCAIDGVLYNKSASRLLRCPQAKTSVTIPTSVTWIYASAFSGCGGLTSVAIPASVEAIGSWAFYGCDGLTEIVVDPDNAWYCSVDGVVYDKSVTEVVCCPGNKAVVTIPQSVKTVGGMSFQGCAALRRVTIPDGVTAIGFQAFTGCSGLETLTIPASVTTIGQSAFAGCSALRELTLPEGVSSIGMGAFQGCGDLGSVAIPTSVVGIGDGAFYACTKLRTVEVAEGDAARVSALLVASGFDVSNLTFVEQHAHPDDESVCVATLGEAVNFDLVEDLGIAIDADYAAGDKVAVKVETLPKGLKLVTTPVYEDPLAKKKVVVGYTYAITGVPTETLDFETKPVFARVSVTRKDPVTGKSVTSETLQRAALAVEAAAPQSLEGVMNADIVVVDASSLWPEIDDKWTFKGWPAGVKYTAKPVKATKTAPEIPAFSIYGRPTKAGVFTVTATTREKEQRFLAFTVWPSEDERSIRYSHPAYTDVLENLGPDVTAASGLPTGLKFTAKDVAARGKTAAQSAGDVYGRPTKPGVYAVQLTLRDPSDPAGRKTLKEKRTILWQVTDGANPGLGAADVGWTAGNVAWDGEAATATVRQGAAVDLGVDLGSLDAAAKVTVSGLPSGLKYDAKTGRITGVATKAERKVVSVKVVQNGVTMTTQFAVETAANPFAGTFVGAVTSAPGLGAEARLAVAEVKVDAVGKVSLSYAEGKTKYTASSKSYAYDLVSGTGVVSGLVLKVSSADRKAGCGDRVVDLVLEDRGLYGLVTLAVRDEAGRALADGRAPCHEVVKTSEVALDALQTCVVAVGAGEPLATLSAAFDAKKGTAAMGGRLFDSTAVKATAALCRRSDETGDVGDYVFAPFLVTGKDKTVYRVAWPADAAEPATVGVVGETGEEEVSEGPKVVCLVGDRKLAEVVADAGTLALATSEAGEEAFGFAVVRDKKGTPTGVEIYDADAAEGEKPLAKVTAKLGKATGGVSVTFTSKKGDKAKYAVELVWQGEQLLKGQVVRTWKDGKTAKTAYGTAEMR